MPSNAINPKVLKHSVKIYVKCGCNTALASKRLGISPRTMRDRLRSAKESKIKVPEASQKLVDLQIESEQKNELLRLRKENELLSRALNHSRNANKIVIPKRKAFKGGAPDDEIRVIVPDSHGAYMQMDAVMAFLEDLERLDPHTVIMLGDHVDCGGFLAQHHTLGYVAECAYTYEDDIKANNWLLDEIQKRAPRAKIEYLEGNHEARVERWCVTQTLSNGKDAEFLRQHFAPEFLLHLKERDIPYYRRSAQYDNLPIAGCIQRGKCFYLHELAGGRNAAQDHLRSFGGSVNFGHIHTSVAYITKNVTEGEIGAWCPGTLAKPRMYFHHSRISTHTNGYALELHSKSGRFLHLNIPIIHGQSNLKPLLAHMER